MQLLRSLGDDFGTFAGGGDGGEGCGGDRLELYRPTKSTFNDFRLSQRLYLATASDTRFMAAYDRLVEVFSCR